MTANAGQTAEDAFEISDDGPLGMQGDPIASTSENGHAALQMPSKGDVEVPLGMWHGMSDPPAKRQHMDAGSDMAGRSGRGLGRGRGSRGGRSGRSSSNLLVQPFPGAQKRLLGGQVPAAGGPVTNEIHYSGTDTMGNLPSTGLSHLASLSDQIDLTVEDTPTDAFGGGRIQMSCPTNARASIARMAQRNKNKHRRLFDGGEGALKHGDIVSYSLHGTKLLTGTVTIPDKGAPGIRCDHCNTVVSCSAFESHAGHGQRRNPYDGITTSSGLTLRQIASRLPSLPDHILSPAPAPRRGSKKAGFESVLTDALGSLAERCHDILSQLDALASSCVLCCQADFDKDEFSDRTVIICDQCEREYHVGCLRSTGRCNLEAVPEGEWFCCTQCSVIRKTMDEVVSQGERMVSAPTVDPSSSNMPRVMEASTSAAAPITAVGPSGRHSPAPAALSAASTAGRAGDPGAAPATGGQRNPLHEYSWQILRGTSRIKDTSNALEQVLAVLQESFDPIIDVTTQEDLLLRMVHALPLGEFDFQGMFTILLKHRGLPVCAGLLRIFGQHMAELPLVATKADARRKGHCRVLIDAIEDLLQKLGVGVLSLPAATAAIPTWINHFSFVPMDQHDVQAVQSELRMLMFPGSKVLYRPVGPEPATGPRSFAEASCLSALSGTSRGLPDDSAAAELGERVGEEMAGLLGGAHVAVSEPTGGHVGEAAVLSEDAGVASAERAREPEGDMAGLLDGAGLTDAEQREMADLLGSVSVAVADPARAPVQEEEGTASAAAGHGAGVEATEASGCEPREEVVEPWSEGRASLMSEVPGVQSGSETTSAIAAPSDVPIEEDEVGAAFSDAAAAAPCRPATACDDQEPVGPSEDPMHVEYATAGDAAELDVTAEGAEEEELEDIPEDLGITLMGQEFPTAES